MKLSLIIPIEQFRGLEREIKAIRDQQPISEFEEMYPTLTNLLHEVELD